MRGTCCLVYDLGSEREEVRHIQLSHALPVEKEGGR